MARIILIPGIGGSSPSHWQSLWHASDPTRFVRLGLSQAELDQPRLHHWLAAIDVAREEAGSDALVAAHSLGCLALAHWAASIRGGFWGALLVSPPDPAAAAFPELAKAFAPVPRRRLGFPSIVVASSSDPFLSIGFARICADHWGGTLCTVEDGGHLGDSAGLGEWAHGRSLLARLAEAA